MGLRPPCWNGDLVRAAFVLDTCDREAIARCADMGGINRGKLLFGRVSMAALDPGKDFYSITLRDIVVVRPNGGCSSNYLTDKRKHGAVENLALIRARLVAKMLTDFWLARADPESESAVRHSTTTN